MRSVIIKSCCLLIGIILLQSQVALVLSQNNTELIVKSPDEQIRVVLKISDSLTYEVEFLNDKIIQPSTISIALDNGTVFGKSPKVKKSKVTSISETITPAIQQKSAQIPDVYNQLNISFFGGYALSFRVYNDGLAYRWESSIKGNYKVVDEQAEFVFDNDYKTYFPEEESFLSHQERKYKQVNLSEITNERFGSTGMLVDLDYGFKAYISESNLKSYPGMYLTGDPKIETLLKGLFAHFPLETRQTNDRTVEVVKYDSFLAKCTGPRTFPWRVIALTSDDAQLLSTEIIYKLADPCLLEDISWIKPGKVAWDWWNDNNIYGVDFKSGINTETYKYYIDFASTYKLDYIILDEGWYHLEDVLKIKKDVDVKELIRYGEEKGVGVILWVTWKGLDDKLEEALDAYAEWGAKGIKVDFMQRDDQVMVDYYYRVAKAAAERKLLVDFHGAYKPTGLRRAYPNVITREGVQGLEHCKWSADSDPEHNVTLPFIRQVAGPMDYTPGAMLNASKDNFKDVFSEPMSLGTRCHQLAMYVVYESPLQMLADNPSNYYKEKDAMKFLSRVPTVWDDTKILEAKLGDYIVTARRSGGTWYIGGMTDWSPRIFKVNLDFLQDDEYIIEIWQDGVNADKHASDYKYLELPVDKTSQLEVKLAPGGGWAAIITKKSRSIP